MRLSATLVLIVAGASVAAVGCGARSELDGLDGGSRGDGDMPECTRDVDCDDGVECTAETCEALRCVVRPVHTSCVDDLFCTGAGACDPDVGCVFPDRPCSDGVTCTEDVCNEDADRCEHTPLASLCPLSHRCDLEIDCVARALVHNGDALWEIDLPSGESRWIGPMELALTDIALYPDGRTFGITGRGLYLVDERDGRTSFLVPLSERSVGLDLHPDGAALVAAGERQVVRIDPDTGVSSEIARFPSGWSASGDIAFVRGRMLVTATDIPGTSGGTNDSLFEVPIDGPEAVPVGEIGFGCIWALAPFGDTLYGFTCRGQLLRIDTDTGAGAELTRLDVLRIGGAAAR